MQDIAAQLKSLQEAFAQAAQKPAVPRFSFWGAPREAKGGSADSGFFRLSSDIVARAAADLESGGKVQAQTLSSLRCIKDLFILRAASCGQDAENAFGRKQRQAAQDAQTLHAGMARKLSDVISAL